MSFKVIIPARYSSTRLPAKMLLKVGGKTIIHQCYLRACESNAEQVIIATDDQRIREEALSFGADVCMTSSAHESGTDRIQEVVHQLGLDEAEIVVNVQGDEPLIPSAVINQVAENLAQFPEAGISTLCEPIKTVEQLMNPNVIKVVFDCNGHALYFSRAPIPWCRDSFSSDDFGSQSDHTLHGDTYYRHVGLYGYRASLLNHFVRWPISRLEAREKLEQLRAMENGVPIHVGITDVEVPKGVDTEQDLHRVRAYFEQA